MKDQGHGSHWETVLGEESIVAKLKEIVQNSGILSKKRAAVVLDDGVEEKDLLTLMCPVSESQIPINFMTILAEQDGRSALVSGYPFIMDGLTVKGRIEDVEIWDNNVEAVVTIKLESGTEICFFATDYHLSKDRYQQGKTCEANIAALAYLCNTDDRFSAALDSSFLSALVRINEDYKDDYKFLSFVQYVESVDIMGIPMSRLDILLGMGNKEQTILPLYVRDTLFRDAGVPKEGEAITGALWMQGHLVNWWQNIENPKSDEVSSDGISSEFMPGRMSEILNRAWKTLQNRISDGYVPGHDSLCETFSDIIKESATDAKDFFVQTGIIPAGSSQRKKVGIVCGFKTETASYSCAIILKFIRDRNSFTSRMFRIYKDLHFLENILCGRDNVNGYSECRFYMVTGADEYRTTPAYKTKSEDFPEFGLNLPMTAKYVRYHDARGTGERQELVFRNEYYVSWYPLSGHSEWHFLEIDVNEKFVDCIVGVFRNLEENGMVYNHAVITEKEYDSFLKGDSGDALEAAFRLSEIPFENVESQPWSLSNGKILYASDIKVSKSAHSVICDVLNDFLVINAAEMGGKTLRVKMEDRKLIKYFSEAEDYLLVGKEKSGIVGKVKAAYFEVNAENFE